MERNSSIQPLAVVTAILLIAGVVLPFVATGQKPEFIFMNFHLLKEDIVPLSVKLYLIFPLFGGMICLMALAIPQFVMRGLMYLFAGFVPMLLGLAAKDDFSLYLFGLQGNSFGNIPGFDSVANLSTLFLIGLLVLVVGALSGSDNRTGSLPPYLAAVGGILTCLSFLIPIQLPREKSMSFLTMAFQIMEKSSLAGLCILLFMALMVGATVVSVLWVVQFGKGAQLGPMVKLLLGIAAAEIILLLVVGSLVGTSRLRDGGEKLAVMIVAVKLFATAVGPFLAKCLGFIELATHAKVSLPTLNLANFSISANIYPAGGQSPAPITQDSVSLESKLKDLQQLLERGVITQEEYDQKRRSLIDKF